MAGKKVIIIGAGRAGLSTGIYALWLQIDTFYGLTFYLRRVKRIDIAVESGKFAILIQNLTGTEYETFRAF